MTVSTTPSRTPRVLLGITGSVAAYKTIELIRLLKKSDIDIRVVMTESAKAFVTPLTLQAISGHNVRFNLLDPDSEAGMDHIQLAKWADLIVIAPASANILARLSHGFADDLLTTLCLASTAPILVTPAMNHVMWQQAVTQKNFHQLLSNPRFICLGPDEGEQACGDMGEGRMVCIEELFATIESCLVNDFSVNQCNLLKHKRVLITAGPTQEALDPVRYLTNYSSGKMGFALARAAKLLGAEVILVYGPVNLARPIGVQCLSVKSAQQMYDVTMNVGQQCDIIIGAAAVANVTNKRVATTKQSTNEIINQFCLVPTNDIMSDLVNLPSRPFCVGFAAQTDDLINKAEQKRKQKGLALMIANQVSETKIGFASDNNEVILLSDQGQLQLPLMSKNQLAMILMPLIFRHYEAFQQKMVTIDEI